MTQKTAQTRKGAIFIADIRYRIDLDQASGERDMGALLLSRRCPSCVDTLLSRKKAVPVTKQIRDMTKCCAAAEDFINSLMPLKEIVFRLLIRGGNKATSLGDLHFAITEEWAHPTHPMNVSVDVLKRILDTDGFYCFSPVVKKGK